MQMILSMMTLFLGLSTLLHSVLAYQAMLDGDSAARVNEPLGHRGNAYPGQIHAPGSDVMVSLADDTFTSFGHPSLPAYNLRIKRTKFCDPTVKGYTGYLDVDYGTKHMFFYFFESRSDPSKDDVLMWINGGPGCSSSLGLFMELGPCSVENPHATADNATRFNPYSWNSNTNLFFLDQPVGVGFSYADYGKTIETTEDAARDVDAFIRLFFETFSQFQGRAFHMAGESYGGRYLPVFASAVVDANALAEAENRTIVNLKSVLIGNGLTDFVTMYSALYDIVCTSVSLPPVLDIATCVEMKRRIPRCQQMLKQECVDRFDAIGCEAATDFCSQSLEDPFISSGLNIYDISRKCEGEDEDTLCYPVIESISTYLNQPRVRKALGVDPNIGNFSSCSSEVGGAFRRHQDDHAATYLYVAGLLERGVKVLVYVGTYDWGCNHVGNYAWVNALEWSGQDGFQSEELHSWEVKGEVVGNTKSYGGLTFATVDGAGHMVPYDKPVEALEMLQRWLKGQDL